MVGVAYSEIAEQIKARTTTTNEMAMIVTEIVASIANIFLSIASIRRFALCSSLLEKASEKFKNFHFLHK